VKDEKGKSRWANVTFDRWFAPRLRKFNPAEFEYEQPQVLNLKPEILAQPQENIDLFEWKDTILDFRETFLKVVEVKGKRPYRPLQGNRYTWDGGEKKGRKHAEYFYNVVLALEQWRDMGRESHISALEFLSFLVDNTSVPGQFEMSVESHSPDYTNHFGNEMFGTSENDSLPYRISTINGNRTAWFLNNDKRTNPKYKEVRIAMDDLLASDIQTAGLVTDKSRVERLLGLGEFNPQIEQVFLVYERPNAYLYRSNKEVTKRNVWGYTPQKKFYSPNYYQMMMPKEPDTRRTLYWSPNLFIDDLGKASVVFFNNSHDGTQLRISIQGLTQDGRMVSYER
jgi:hypothetical protein